MELTGKCKEDFEKWLKENNKDLLKLSDPSIYFSEIFSMSALFKYLTESMQYGVLEDFFDSLDVFIYIIAWETEGGDFYFKYEIIGFWGNHSASLRCDTRQEARTAAIEKANELYNL
jgi:hypothetical protein